MNDALFTVIGYIAFTVYTVGIMLLGVLLERKTNIDPTLARKLTHIASAFVWVICYFFFECSIHWVILNAVGAALLGIITLNDRFSAFSRTDSRKSYGMFYFALSTGIVAVICYFVNRELYLYTGIAYYCLALGDGLAPITARLFGRYNVEICPSKTLVGTLTVYAVSFLSTLVFSSVFDLGMSVWFMLSVGALTAVTEFYGLRGTDNLFCEFFVFGYLVLYHYGLVSPALMAVLIASPLLAAVAIRSHAMATDAGIAAFFLFAASGFCGKDFVPVVFICILFLLSTVVSVIGKKLSSRVGGIDGEHKPRRANQIIAVGLFAILSLIAYKITDVSLFYYIYFLALIEQMADSMASDIGRLTKRKNINIITFKPIDKGISGGVSLLGTGAALVSSFLFALIPLLLNAISLKVFLFISLFAFFGTIIDSVVGALFQSLYECGSCKRLTESTLHCGIPSTRVKGIAIIDNVAVNYIAGFLTCAIGVLLIFIGE